MAVNELSTVAKILGYQLAITIVISIGFFVGGGQKALFSALGGLAAFIPNMFFALRISSKVGMQNTRKILNSFYVGESMKLLLTAAIFIMIFQIPKIELLPLLTGYVAALSVFWFALLMR